MRLASKTLRSPWIMLLLVLNMIFLTALLIEIADGAMDIDAHMAVGIADDGDGPEQFAGLVNGQYTGRSDLDLSAFTARPVFHANRKRYVAPAAPAPQPVQPVVVRRNFQLVGIMKNAKGRRWAYVKDLGSGDVEKVMVDQAFDGWQVEVIEDDRLVMQKGDERLILELNNGDKDGANNPQNQRGTGNSSVRTRRSRKN